MNKIDGNGDLSLAGAAIVPGPSADAAMHLAARELARYLYLLTGRASSLADGLPGDGPAVVLDRALAESLGAGETDEALGEEGFAIHTGRRGAQTFAAVVAVTPRGLRHGVYALLEELGAGFYLGGDTLPEGRTAATLPLPLRRIEKPAFATRGVLLHDNLLVGTTTWGLPDYQSFFDQLAHMRCNTFVLAHYGDAAAEVWDEDDGRVFNHWPIMSSMTRKWGATRALRTAQFAFGTGDCFDEEIFACPAAQALADPIAQRREAVRVFREATRYAVALGIRVVSGFWAPVGDVNDPADPTDPRVVERFKQRVRQYLARNPHLGCFMLINHESGGCCGTALPGQAGAARQLFESQRGLFQYLGNPRRTWEAIRFGRFARIAYDVLQETASHLPLVLCGWGGDRWMRFADFFPGYDTFLPPEVIFSCFDNINPSYAKSVSAALGELPPGRQRWAIPWVEADGTDCCTPQPNVASLAHLAPDALRKGCQGFLTMQWSTRDAEEEAGYAARFGWEPSLTPETFYQRMGRDAFGAEHAEAMAGHLLTLQQLGRRWTGVMGTSAVGEMVFAGAKPHAPFELDARAVEHLLPMARDAAQRLDEPFAKYEQGDYEGAMFALAADAYKATGIDPARVGVKEYREVIRRLEGLGGENDPDTLRTELEDILEVLFEVRTRLIERWMSSAQFCATDGVLVRLHHLLHYAGVRSRGATLERIRADLARRRGRLGHGGREPLDYLAATMDFVTRFDRVAVLLADGEAVDRVLQQKDASQAAAAYESLVVAGMREAVLALTRKLTTRCEFGVLSIVNTKPLGAYWDAIAQLETLMPAAPPRELFAQVHGDEVHLWWAPLEEANGLGGLHIHRQTLGTDQTQRLTAEPLPADGAIFIDRPPQNARCRYTVTALDGVGWESPHSHGVEVNLRDGSGPRLVACRPPSVVAAGKPLEVRVVAFGDRAVTRVTLQYRVARPGAWQSVPMRNRFRCSYQAVIPGEQIQPGILEWFVEATDESGPTSAWPPTAVEGRPWTACVTALA